MVLYKCNTLSVGHGYKRYTIFKDDFLFKYSRYNKDR